MSRYYNIVIGAETQTQPGGQPASNNPGMIFTNQAGGLADPNGVQVELNLPVTSFAGFVGVSSGGRVTIRGVGIDLVSQATNFNGAPITVSGGMQNGLPLATAAANQSGILVQGTILSAYGNWIGVEQSLEFILMPSNWPTQGGPPQAATATPPIDASGQQTAPIGPGNFAFTWAKGSKLSDMITNTFKTALPTYTVNISISPNLVLTQNEPGFYQTVPQFAKFVHQVSLDILGPSNPNYTGVQIAQVDNKTLNVFDNVTQTSTSNPPTQLVAQDFIGQPTWLGPNTMQFNTVLRADLRIGSYVKFPQALNLQTITTPNSQSFARQNSIFQGTWLVTFITHIGNSRGPNALDWITTFQATNPSWTATQASAGNASG